MEWGVAAMRAGRPSVPWTEVEIERMLTLYADQTPMRGIADALERSYSAVQSKFKELRERRGLAMRPALPKGGRRRNARGHNYEIRTGWPARRGVPPLPAPDLYVGQDVSPEILARERLGPMPQGVVSRTYGGVAQYGR